MSRGPSRRDTEAILAEADATLLDLVDNLLNKGVVVTGEVVLGLARVDLVYLRLSALLCAADRIFPEASGGKGRRARESESLLRRR
jgi:Gas vesicle protein